MQEELEKQVQQVGITGSQDFKRLRIGIGRSKNNHEGATIDFVLSKFSKSELNELNDTLSYAPNIINDLINQGIDFIMNKYNK